MFERRGGERIIHEEQISLGRGDNIGLQARLLMGGDYLDPSRELKKDVRQEHLNITAETYKPLERLSELERKQFWKDQAPDKNPQEQKQIWAQNVVSVIEGKKDYFESEEGKKRKELYRKLGINFDGFNQDSAISMYNRFFSPERKGHEVERFIEDILYLDIYYNPNNKTLNFSRVKEDLEAFAWLGNIFGSGSALVMTELIAAEARIHDIKEEQLFIKELNKKDKWFGRGQRRIDKLNKAEKGLCEYMNEANKTGELKVPEKLQKYIKIPVINIPADVLPPPPVDFEEDTKELGLLGATSAAVKKMAESLVNADKYLQERRKAHRLQARRSRLQPVRPGEL